MKSILNKLYFSLNKIATQGFFHSLNSFHLFLVFLNFFWVRLILVSLLLLILLKIFMGVVLGSHIFGKFIVVLIFLKNSLPFINYWFRDFQKGLFIWLEVSAFLIFSIQVVVILVITLYDLLLYFLYHRQGIPCDYWGESVDITVESLLQLVLNFFMSFFV